MKPIVFGGRFGWLHPGESKHGVVLCSPFGHEQSRAYKGMRYLAERLSAHGLAVLRFDYLTTGDSTGNDGEGDRVDGFVADIGAAVERLKSETGVTKVTLCGLRLGATLAALASHHPLVDSLVLLAPVTRGRTYLRELTALRRTWLENLPPPVRHGHPDSPFNVLGQVYSDAFCSRLSALDLATAIGRQPVMPARVLVADVRPAASDSLCVALRKRGVEVETHSFDDYFDFMQETATSVVPVKTLTRTAQWVAENAAARTASERMPARTTTAARPSTGSDCHTVIETPEAIERPVVFGRARLFGILCEPRERRAGGPVLLITNTAASVHHGDSRLSVRVAREMARRGIASMRMDAGGIGDSPPRSPDGALDTTESIYSNATVEDVAAAAAWLKHKGFDTVVTFGVCSGAYSALRASLIEPAIGAVIAVNLQRFYISEGTTLKELQEQNRNTMARLGAGILKPTKWWLVLSGKRGLRPIAEAFASNVMARLRSQVIGLAGNNAGPATEQSFTDPQGVVRGLEQKKVRTLLLYGAGDDGLDQLNAHFGKHGKKLPEASTVKAAVFSDVDHALFDPRASAKIIALSETFIRDLHTKTSSSKGAVSPLALAQRL
jgi:pimeloyl-ACP methyl ester carboxylesterase